MVLAKKKFNEALGNTEVQEFEKDLEKSIDQALLDWTDLDEEKRRKNGGWPIIWFEGRNTWDSYGSGHTYHLHPLGYSMQKFTKSQQQIIRDYIVEKYKNSGWKITWNQEDVGFGSTAHVLRIG